MYNEIFMYELQVCLKILNFVMENLNRNVQKSLWGRHEFVFLVKDEIGKSF